MMLIVLMLAIPIASCVFLHSCQPYGPRMCSQLKSRLKGCYVEFDTKIFTCKITFLRKNEPQVCLETQRGQITCVEMLQHQKVSQRNRRVKLLEVVKNGTVIYGSSKQLLLHIKDGGFLVDVQVLYTSVKWVKWLDIQKFSIQSPKPKAEISICGYTDSHVMFHGRNNLGSFKRHFCICSSGYLDIYTQADGREKVGKRKTNVHMIWYGRKSTVFKYTYGPNKRNISIAETYAQTACDTTWIKSGGCVYQRVQFIGIYQSELRFGLIHTPSLTTKPDCSLIASTSMSVFTKCYRIKNDQTKPKLHRNQQDGAVLFSEPWVETYSPPSHPTDMKLFQSIRRGHRVKILIHYKYDIVMEARYLTIKPLNICGYFAYLDNVLLACTYLSSFTYSYFHLNRKQIRPYKHTWFVDEEKWELIFHRNVDGKIVFGSLHDMFEKLCGNPSIRVATVTKGVEIYRNVVGIHLNPNSRFITADLEPTSLHDTSREYCNLNNKGFLSCVRFSESNIKPSVTSERCATKWFTHH